VRRDISLLLVVVFIKQLLWCSFLPLWQTPDEQAHFGEVSLFTQTGGPQKTGNNLSKEIFTAEKILGTDRDDMGNNKFTYHPDYRSVYTTENEQTIIAQPLSNRTDFVKKESTGYPPLYYWLASLVEKLVYFGSLFDRVFVIRTVSSLTLVALTFVAYKVGEEVLAKKEQALFLATAVGFAPMLTFVHAGVTSDALFNLFFAVFLLACLKQNWLAMVITFGLSLLTKPQAYIMSLVAIPVVFSSPLLILTGVLLLIPLLGLIRAGRIVVPETGGIQLTDIFSGAFVEHLKFTAGHTYREVLPWYWGVFRWLSLGLPEVLRKITNWLTLLSFAGLGVSLLKNVNRKLLFLIYSLGIYFLAITIFDFGFRQAHGYSFGIQGRYFFPVIVAQMTIFIVGLKPIAKWLAIGMIIFNMITFFWVIGSYYSLSWPAFFIEASEYKPLWLKFPINLGIFFVSVLTNSILVISILIRSGDGKNRARKMLHLWATRLPASS